MRWATTVLLLVLGGCGIFCSYETQVLELVPDEPFYDYKVELLDDYRRTGWDCVHDGDIRNAAGTAIGSRWVCTKCR